MATQIDSFVSKKHVKYPMVFLGLMVFLCIVFFTDLNPEKPAMTMTMAVVALMAIWWITEAVPIAITSLLPIVLFPVMGILDGKTVSATYVNYIIFLFLGGFIMALALEKWQLHKRIALKILSLLGSHPLKVLIGFMLTTSFLSMWISNTATTMMMIPIAFSVYESLKSEGNQKNLPYFNTALLLGIAYSASIGGITTLVGTVPNLSFVRIFEILYPNVVDISFGNWLLFTFPLTIVMLCITLAVLYLLFPIRGMAGNNTTALFKKSYRDLGKMTAAQKRVLVLFSVLILLWIFRKSIQIGSFTLPGWSGLFGNPKWINDGTTAVFIALLLFIIPSKTVAKAPLLDWSISKKMPWDIVFLLGGGFALAKAFTTTGLADYIGTLITTYSSKDHLWLMGIATGLMSLATEFTSNTATTEMLLPIISGIANKVMVHPLLLMLPVTLAASMAFMFPVATPPNAIIFGTGKLKVKDMLKTGIILNTLAVICICLLTYFWAEIAFDIDFNAIDFMKKK